MKEIDQLFGNRQFGSAADAGRFAGITDRQNGVTSRPGWWAHQMYTQSGPVEDTCVDRFVEAYIHAYASTDEDAEVYCIP